MKNTKAVLLLICKQKRFRLRVNSSSRSFNVFFGENHSNNNTILASGNSISTLGESLRSLPEKLNPAYIHCYQIDLAFLDNI